MSKELSQKQQAEEALKGGGSFFLNDVQYTQELIDKGQLKMPTEADFAEGDPDAEKAALNALEAEMFRIAKDAEDLRAKLGVRSSAAKSSATKSSESEVEVPEEGEGSSKEVSEQIKQASGEGSKGNEAPAKKK